MQEEKNLYEQLWRLADNECSPAERSELLARIEADTAWQRAWKEVRVLNGSLASMSVFSPAPDFAKSIVARIKVPAVKTSASASLLPDRTKWMLLSGFGLLALLAVLSSKSDPVYSSDSSTFQWWFDLDLWGSLTAHLPTSSTVMIILALVSAFSFDQLIGWYRKHVQY